jgi:hypothetical protein
MNVPRILLGCLVLPGLFLASPLTARIFLNQEYSGSPSEIYLLIFAERDPQAGVYELQGAPTPAGPWVVLDDANFFVGTASDFGFVDPTGAGVAAALPSDQNPFIQGLDRLFFRLVSEPVSSLPLTASITSELGNAPLDEENFSSVDFEEQLASFLRLELSEPALTLIPFRYRFGGEDAWTLGEARTGQAELDPRAAIDPGDYTTAYGLLPLFDNSEVSGTRLLLVELDESAEIRPEGDRTLALIIEDNDQVWEGSLSFDDLEIPFAVEFVRLGNRGQPAETATLIAEPSLFLKGSSLNPLGRFTLSNWETGSDSSLRYIASFGEFASDLGSVLLDEVRLQIQLLLEIDEAEPGHILDHEGHYAGNAEITIFYGDARSTTLITGTFAIRAPAPEPVSEAVALFP